MSRLNLEAKVGIFFLVCAAIFAYAWFVVLGLTFEKGFELQARFRSVQGLTEGAQVQIAGIKVGTVKEIRWDRDSGKALVIMEIKADYRNSITEGARVLLKSKGLLGDRFVVIEPDKPNARKLKAGEEISLVHEGTDFEETVENLSLAAQDIKLLSEEARKQMLDEKGAEKLARTLEHSNKFFKEAKELITENKDRITSTLKDTRGAAKKLDELLDRNKDKINRTVDQAERASGNMDKTGGRFSKLADDLESLSRDVRSGKGTLGRLVVDESLYRDAGALVRDLRQISSRIQSGPGTVSRLVNDPELYYEARRAIRNMNKTAEDVSEATPVSTLAIILGSILK